MTAILGVITLTLTDDCSDFDNDTEYELEQILLCDDFHEKSDRLLDFLTIEPKNAKAYMELARCHMELDNFEIGKTLLEKSLSIDCNGWTYIWLSYCYICSNDYTKAEIELHKAISVMPTNGTAFSILAEIYEEQGKLKECEDLHKKALGFNPDFAENHVRYADFLIRAKRCIEATASLKWALYIEPKCEMAIELMNQNNLFMKPQLLFN